MINQKIETVQKGKLIKNSLYRHFGERPIFSIRTAGYGKTLKDLMKFKKFTD